jgi:chorismate mutase
MKVSLLLAVTLTTLVASQSYGDPSYDELDNFDSQQPLAGEYYDDVFDPPDSASYGSASSCPNDLVSCTVERATAQQEKNTINTTLTKCESDKSTLASRLSTCRADKKALASTGTTCQGEVDDLQSELDDCLIERQLLTDENADLKAQESILTDPARYPEILAYYRQDATNRCKALDQTIVTVSGVRFKLYCNRGARNVPGWTANWKVGWALSLESCLEGCVRARTCWQVGFDMRASQATYANRCDVLQNKQDPPLDIRKEDPEIRIAAVRL